MSAAAYKATSNPRSGGSDSHHPLPQVPEIPSTDDEEIHSSSSSLVALDGVSASVSSNTSVEVPSSSAVTDVAAATTAALVTASTSFSSNASASSSSAQVR